VRSAPRDAEAQRRESREEGRGCHTRRRAASSAPVFVETTPRQAEGTEGERRKASILFALRGRKKDRGSTAKRGQRVPRESSFRTRSGIHAFVLFETPEDFGPGARLRGADGAVRGQGLEVRGLRKERTWISPGRDQARVKFSFRHPGRLRAGVQVGFRLWAIGTGRWARFEKDFCSFFSLLTAHCSLLTLFPLTNDE
jgi:hypothetical protein